MSEHGRRDIDLGDLSAMDNTSTGHPVLSARPVSAPVRNPVGLPAAPGRGQLLLGALAGLVALLLAGLVLLLLEQRELQRALTTLQAAASESVASLEDRVASTSTTLKSTDSETQKSLNVLAADIGKLDHAQNQLAKALEQLTRQHTATAATLRAQTAELQRVDQARQQADSQQEARLKAQAEAQEALSVRVKTLADNLARLERSSDAAQLRTEVAVLATGVRDLQDQLDRRLKATEQATASNDAFRRQVNATIDRLNQQVSELYQRR